METYENIITASGDGLLDVVQTLVSSGILVNTQDELGYSPLHVRFILS